jgi:hypothetical protein
MKYDVRQSDVTIFETGYSFMKFTEHFISLQTSVVITKDYKVRFNGEEFAGTKLTGTKVYLTFYAWCRINNVVITGVDCKRTFRRAVPILRVRFTLLS